VDVPSDFSELRLNRRIVPLLEGPSQINPNDLPENTGIDLLLVARGEGLQHGVSVLRTLCNPLLNSSIILDAQHLLVRGWTWKQWGLIAILTLGYALFYLCRSNLSVGRTLLIEAYAHQGWTKETVGLITSVATGFYALGKFLGGAFAEKAGGKTSFMMGMAGAVVFNLVFAFAGGFPLFMAAWCGNRLLQAFGWPGMVKLAGQWFSSNSYGTVMGLLSLSYLFGDFASRKALGWMIASGAGWRELFWIPSICLAAFSLVALAALPKKDVQEVAAQAASPRTSTQVLFQNRAFWIVCILSFIFTLMRETFNEWTPTLLEELGGLSKAQAADQSSWFPLAGGISVLLVGFASDRLGPDRRLQFILGGLVLSALLLFGLYVFQGAYPPVALAAIVAFLAFLLIGPYSLLAGAISLDLGGEDLGATACGWIDGVGYIGGMVSGYGIASLVQNLGWLVAFLFLGVLCLLGSATCLGARVRS
jgi:sugar phosphate permease